MKNMTKTSFLVLLFATALAGCKGSTSTTKTVYTTVTNPSTSTGTGTTITGCSDGVARNGVTDCYYSDFPSITASGPGTKGITLWSSKNLSSSYSQNRFVTDATLAVRIKASYSDALATSVQGRTCSSTTRTNYTKMKVWVGIRRATDSLPIQILELYANANSYSNTARFTVPKGTLTPFIVEVIGVNTDHRCNSVYGSLVAADLAACKAGTLYYDIPENTKEVKNPTECVTFKMDVATDDTYDLPN